MAMAIVELQDSALIGGIDGVDEPAGDLQLRPGTRVEVKRRFDAKWARGFEVLEHDTGRYRLLRLSDGEALPVLFTEDDVRPEKRNNTWWI
jgi:hypothetical protein